MSNVEYKAYLDGLKPGDTITYVARDTYLSDAKTTASITIVRRTPKQIVCKTASGYEIRYRAEDGRRVGGSYFDRLPLQATDDDLNLARIESARRLGANKLDRHVWSKEPAEVISAVLKLIEKKEPK